MEIGSNLNWMRIGLFFYTKPNGEETLTRGEEGCMAGCGGGIDGGEMVVVVDMVG